jgi:hypothetical protein
MKNYLLILLHTFFLISTASCEKQGNESMQVIRDCTGTYLRKDGKDYMVCNLEKVSQFADATKVKASFIRISECKGSAINQIVCLMYHQNEGWIEVKEIK